MATSSTSASELTCVSKREDLTIIETSSESEVYVYTIPSFPVFSVQLRRMKWQFVAEETGSTHVCDGYVRHCAEINKFMGPVTVHVDKGYSCMFFIEKEEFERCLDTRGMTLFNNKVLILWKWYWINEDRDSDDIDDSIIVVSETELSSEAEDNTVNGCSHTEDETIDRPRAQLQHSVVFKCIGASKDSTSQQALCRVARELDHGNQVEVRLQPEENNPVNSRALAFMCCLQGKWIRIGYVVEEALEAVHDALSKSEIISLEFNWVKYIIHWSRSGPGWYAGINITKMGNWPPCVVNARSVRY